MAKTIVGVFDDPTEAGKVLRELTEAGFLRDDISILARQENGGGPDVGPVETVSAAPSVGAGTMIGGLSGFAAGLVFLAVPGIGPVLAAGPIAAELVGGGIGAVAGGVLTRLKQRGVPEEDAGCFCEAVRRGGILVSIETTDDRAADAERILGEHRVVDIEDCATHWREHGWKGFEPDATPVSAPEPPTEEKKSLTGLPFDPSSLSFRDRRERRDRRAVRSYVRIS